MSKVMSRESEVRSTSETANALADRLEKGVDALIALASSLTDSEWQTRIPKDGRKVGVVVHHVASVYPIEIQLAKSVAAGDPLGATWDDVHAMNAGHAKDNDGVTKAQALELLRKNSAEAAAAIRGLTDQDLSRSAPLPMYSGAPLTCQFALEDHAVRHAYHHLGKIKKALNR